MKAALRLATNRSKQRRSLVLRHCIVIPFSDSGPQTARDASLSKHPLSQPAQLEILLHHGEDPPIVHPVLFESIDGTVIRTAALRFTD